MYQTYGVKASDKGYSWTASIASASKAQAARDRKRLLQQDGVTRAITYRYGQLYRLEGGAGK